MLAKTLQQLIDKEATSAKEIGELTGVATSTVYRWVSGESEPDFNSIRILLRHLKHQEAQRAILSVFTANTGFYFSYIEVELDLNDDGVVDHRDALTAAIEAVHGAGVSVSRLREILVDREITKAECVEMHEHVNRVEHYCVNLRQILSHMSEDKRHRLGKK